jgi:exopolysaccharide production protein ExoY
VYRFGVIEADRTFSSGGSVPAGRYHPKSATQIFNAGRALDVLIALAALIFAAPLMIALALAIRLQDGGPAIFGHTRVGRGGRSFRCYKFRSMVTDSDARLQALLAVDPEARREWEVDRKLRNDPRITAIGAFLRKSSLDELPQIFNVLKGEMSIVGPRPIVAAEIRKYGASFHQYCAVRPGITGLWQVSGRNDVAYRRRVALDRLYARSKCVSLDLRILLLTIPAVLSRSGSY